MTSLRFRAPGHPLALVALLARALPGVRPERVAALVAGGAVRVGGRPAPSGRAPVPPGSLVVARDAPLARPPFDPIARPRAAGAGGGAWWALVPSPPWRRASLAPAARGGVAIRYEATSTRDGVTRLRLEAGDAAPLAIAEALAAAGTPLLGDPLHGGVLVAGGVRLRALDAASPDARPDGEELWPDEPAFLPAWDASEPAACLAVSGGTLRALARGHPWVLADRETGDTGRFQAGALVRLVPAAAKDAKDDGAGRAPLACVEGGAIAARLWSAGGGREAAGVESRVARALALRRELTAGAAAPDGTDAYRLVHGEADGLPGLAVDRLGGLLRVLVSGRACEAFRERAVDALVRGLARELGAEPPVVEVLHLRPAPAGALERVRLARGRRPELDAEGRLLVHERGLAFWVDPGLRDPERATPGVGLFLDQRENRARLAARARRGGRWLNLFAHTGAFSVALLAAGAREVVSVDLSKAYLRWLEEHVARNRLPAERHRAICGDGRRVLEKLPLEEPFDGIVIDPPTAAAAGRRFWSVRRDLSPLLEHAFRRLTPGGTLLVARNDRAARGSLADGARAAAGRAGVALASVAPAGPGPDFPSLPGFPEGDPFEGVLARRRGR